MQAIEYTTRVQDQSIPLPPDMPLAPGQAVKVIVLYESPAGTQAESPKDGPVARLMRNPLVVPGFKPFSRDEAHER
jgi:hypothetical protein